MAVDIKNKIEAMERAKNIKRTELKNMYTNLTENE